MRRYNRIILRLIEVKVLLESGFEQFQDVMRRDNLNILRLIEVTVLLVLDISDVSLLETGMVELAARLVISLLPEIEGAAKRLRPARQTTPNGLLDRIALDLMVEQTLLWYVRVTTALLTAPVSKCRDFTGDKIIVTTINVCPFAFCTAYHSDAVLVGLITVSVPISKTRSSLIIRA